MISLKIDDSALTSYFDNLLSEMGAGYEQTLHKAAELVSHDIDEQFLQGGNPKWVPLSATTILFRHERAKTTGVQPVAGFEAPERYTDKLRLASTATNSGVEGTAFQIDQHSVTVGVDPQGIDYAEKALGLSGDPRIPERNPFILQPQTEAEILSLFNLDLTNKLAE